MWNLLKLIVARQKWQDMGSPVHEGMQSGPSLGALPRSLGTKASHENRDFAEHESSNLTSYGQFTGYHLGCTH
jgi:hypothetical protein